MYAKIITGKGQFEALVECDRIYFAHSENGKARLTLQLGREPEVEWILDLDDKVYVMNDMGRTIDSFLMPSLEASEAEPQTTQPG